MIRFSKSYYGNKIKESIKDYMKFKKDVEGYLLLKNNVGNQSGRQLYFDAIFNNDEDLNRKGEIMKFFRNEYEKENIEDTFFYKCLVSVVQGEPVLKGELVSKNEVKPVIEGEGGVSGGKMKKRTKKSNRKLRNARKSQRKQKRRKSQRKQRKQRKTRKN